MVPTAWGSRGEPLLPDLPDPTPEPRENGSCHTPRSHTHWEAARRRSQPVQRTENDQGHWGLGRSLGFNPNLLNAKLALPPLSPTPDSRPP